MRRCGAAFPVSVTGMSGTIKAARGGVGGAVADANFAQSTIRTNEVFSPGGVTKYSELAGRPINTVDDLATAIRDGRLAQARFPWITW